MSVDGAAPAHDFSCLTMIKSHLDSHGVACAIIKDHIAIGLATDGDGLGAASERVLRVRSFGEACEAIGCDCRCHERE